MFVAIHKISVFPISLFFVALMDTRVYSSFRVKMSTHLIYYWGKCRNLHVGVPGYGPPKVISTHFCLLVTDSVTTFPQSTFEGKTQ